MSYSTDALAEIARLRDRTIAAHKRCTSPLTGCRPGCVKHPPWPTPELNARPTPQTDVEWAGLARMAAARRHAGQPLTPLDLTALTRCEQAAA